MTPTNVVLMMAMQAEAQPFIDECSLKQTRAPWNAAVPFPVYKGKIHDADVTVVLGGKDKRFDVDNIGTNAATLAAFLAIEYFKPDFLLNAGTAGGFARLGAEIGDVYLANAVKFHDRRIALPGFDRYGAGSYDTSRALEKLKSLNLKEGIVSTGNSLDALERDLEIMKTHGVVVKDMEAGAIAWVAEMFDQKLVILKSVTDIVDSARPSHEEFLENLEAASRHLRDKLTAVIAALA